MMKLLFKRKLNILSIVAFLLFGFLFNIISLRQEEAEFDFTNKSVCLTMGSYFASKLLEYDENINLIYLKTTADAAAALNNGRCDYIVNSEAIMAVFLKEYPNFEVLKEGLFFDEIALTYLKDDPDEFFVEFDQFIEESNKNGLVDELKNKWVLNNESDYVSLSLNDLDANNKVMKIGIMSDRLPHAFLKNGEVTGYEVDLMLEFASKYGYRYDVTYVNFDNFIQTIVTGKIDMAIGDISISEERSKILSFSKPTFRSNVNVIAVDPNYVEEATDSRLSIMDRINRLLIEEDRYIHIFNGILVTLYISFSSIIIGTLLGFIFARVIMAKNNKILLMLFKAINILYTGVPIVVILTFAYYGIFADFAISPNLMSIAVFSIYLALNVATLTKTSIETIPKGQSEAALSLGFSKIEGFVRFIVPQAARIFLPTYKQEIVSLIKLTSITSFITVEDLTRVVDIIRGDTFDPFLPLIAAALVYFILCILMTKSVEYFIGLIDPNTRKRTIKGVVTNEDVQVDTLFEHNQHEKEELIKIEHAEKNYGKIAPLKDVNTTIYKGDVISIIGPSGTGKSTLLRALNYLDPITNGKIYYKNELINEKTFDLTKIRKNMQMVFQSFNLFNHLMVIENVMVGPIKLLNYSKHRAYNEAKALLKLVGLSDHIYKYPAEMSGGQKQRVAIARALAMKPEVILLDEPTSALDPGMVAEVLNVIKMLANKGVTLLIVTHEMKFAQDVSNKIFYMDLGLIYEEGSPDVIFNNPKKQLTRDFILKTKNFNRIITSKGFDYIQLNTQLIEYANNLYLDNHITYSLQLVIEEIFYVLILNKLSEQFVWELNINYDKKENQLHITMEYDNDKYDPSEDYDELVKSLLKDSVVEYEYSYVNLNKINMIIK